VSPSAAPLPAGYREAAEAARQQLVAIATDNGKDPEAFRRDLVNIAKTTLSSKILTQGGWVHACRMGGRAGECFKRAGVWWVHVGISLQQQDGLAAQPLPARLPARTHGACLPRPAPAEKSHSA
jgi:hypothetical protein